jgi:histidinol-phosphate/aromatic aminotransferase/cobyric acid decarboxylase-like protein
MYTLPRENNNKFNLNLNESNYPVPFTLQVTDQNIKLYNKASSVHLLEEKLRDYTKITSPILFTAGSDMALHLIIEVLYFQRKKRTILLPLPTYTHMQLYCEKYFETDYLKIHIAENDSLDKISKALSLIHYDIIYIVTPNNPTGKSLSPNELTTLFTSFPDTFFIIDEAYIEFSPYIL